MLKNDKFKKKIIVYARAFDRGLKMNLGDIRGSIKRLEKRIIVLEKKYENKKSKKGK